MHIDDGFDTEISKSNINISKLCKAANIELRTLKPDSKQYNALTLAYMKAVYLILPFHKIISCLHFYTMW